MGTERMGAAAIKLGGSNMMAINRRHSSRLFVFLILSLLLASFTLQIPPALAAPDDKEVIAGVPANFPPQYQVDAKTGKPYGFAIDVMDEIARRSGIKVRYVVYGNWSGVTAALKKGEIDVVPNFGITDERKKYTDFTAPVETFQIKIFVRSTTEDINSIDDLAGRKVAVVSENQGYVIMKERGGTELLVYDSMEEALMALISGNADAMVYPEAPLLLVARQSGLEDHIKTTGESLAEIKRSIGVRKGQPELYNKLDETVKAFILTPEYEKLYQKWYGKPKPFWNTERVLAAVGIAIILAAVIFFVLHYFSVLRLNKKLADTLAQLETSEKSLRESEERYRMLVDNSMDAVLLTAPDGSILSANPTACRMFGRTEEEICQGGRAGIVDVTDPRLPVMLEERARTGKFKGELTLIRKDGTKFPGEITTAIFKDKDGLDRTSMIIRDITERKRAEEALRKSEMYYRSLFENMVEGFAYCRMLFENDEPQDFIYLNVNRAFEELTGLNNVVGKKVTEVIPGIRESNPELFEIYGRVALSGMPERFESHSESFGGWLSVSVYSPEKGYFIAVFDNITERKLAEEELKKHREHLEEMVKERTAELEKKTTELERMNRLFVGRELRMVELKQKIAELEKEIGDMNNLLKAEK